jgi:hypothetical protein
VGGDWLAAFKKFWYCDSYPETRARQDKGEIKRRIVWEGRFGNGNAHTGKCEYHEVVRGEVVVQEQLPLHEEERHKVQQVPNPEERHQQEPAWDWPWVSYDMAGRRVPEQPRLATNHRLHYCKSNGVGSTNCLC